jgi:hypothetical protein
MLRDRIARLVCVGVIAASHATARADSKQENLNGEGVAIPDPVPGASPLIAPSTQAFLTSSVSASSDTPKFRATIVPSRAFDVAYVEVLSEFKFSILTNSDTSLTELSLGASFNPFAIRGYWVSRLLPRGGPQVPEDCPSQDEILRRLALPEKHCGDKELLYACALNTIAELKAANEADQATIASAQDEIRKTQHEMLKMLATTGKAVPEAPAMTKRVEDTHRRVEVAMTKTAGRTKLIDKLKKPDDVDAKTDKCERKRLAERWSKINATLLPSVGATGFIDLFPYGRAPDPLDTTAQMTAGLEHWGGSGVQLSLSFHLSEHLSLDLSGTHKRTRAKGDPHTRLANTDGAAATAAYLAFPFLNQTQLQNDDDYIKSGFIPGIAIGASVQHSDCDGREQCAKQRTTQTSVTPFLDIRVNSKLQLRLSVPLTWYESTDKDGKDIAPTFSLAGEVSSL